MRKTKIRYAGSKVPRGHPPALGKTLVNRKPVARPKLAPVRITQPVRKPPVDPLTQIFNRYRSQVLTEDQMQKQAESYVSNQLNPNYDIVKREADRLRSEAASRRDALSAAYSAAASANAGMAPQILAGFQSAASTLGSLAGAATGQVGAAQRADIAAQNQALQTMGQATINQDPSQQQGVENYVGGYLPSANLAQLGAVSQAGFLGEVADQRRQAVALPWGAYQKEIGDLNDKELGELSDLAQKRPDLVQTVLEKLRSNNEKVLGGMLDVEKERADRRQQAAKIQQAQATLNFKYREARAKARTTADKAAIDRWYKNQQVKLSAARNAISATNAQTSITRAQTGQYNAQTSRIRATTQASGFKPLSEVLASMGRSRRDIPRGQSRAKIAAALYQQYSLSVAPAQRKALRAAIVKWVNTLPLQQKRGSTKSSIFTPK